MNIGVIGAGNIGGTLGMAWARSGHAVRFGVRDPEAPAMQALLAQIKGAAAAGTVAEAAAFGDVVLLAIPGRSVDPAVREHGEALAGKIVIDATNQTGRPEMHSLATISAAVPQVKAYRAFNSVGWENMAQPRFGDERASMFFCGPLGESRDTVAGLIRDVGFDPVYVGDQDAAPLLDNLTRLWFTLVAGQGYNRHTAFRLLRGEDG